MNDVQTSETDERSWVERLTQFLSGTPQNRADLEGLLELAVDNELIDDDAKTIMEGALSVSDMQVRDIMIPRAQMTIIKIDAELDEALPHLLHHKVHDRLGHAVWPEAAQHTKLLERVERILPLARQRVRVGLG